MTLWEGITVGDRDGPDFPGPADTLTTAEAHDMTAIRIGALEATVYAQRQELARLRRWCSATWARVAELQTLGAYTGKDG